MDNILTDVQLIANGKVIEFVATKVDVGTGLFQGLITYYTTDNERVVCNPHHVIIIEKKREQQTEDQEPSTMEDANAE